MLDQLLIHQVRRRLKASGLPLAVELWNGELLEPSTLAAVRIRLHHMASLKALAYPNLGALARAYVEGALDLEGSAWDILALGDRLCNAGGFSPKTGSENETYRR